jgi:S1-C subfamily serine protease
MRGIEPLLLKTTRISTFAANRVLTAGTGFFFRRDENLYLVTSRHVLFDPPAAHAPDWIEIVLHADAIDLTRNVVLSIPLYAEGKSRWMEGTDSGGKVDVAVIHIPESSLPAKALLAAFTPEDLQLSFDEVEVGQGILLVGLPLGFYDVVHNLPVVRQGSIASSFGVRFQGKGYFLTDARMHRGSSGAPVVLRTAAADGSIRQTLLGIHSARMDMSTRDIAQDDVLGLNCAWYADMLMTLTDKARPAPVSTPPPT